MSKNTSHTIDFDNTEIIFKKERRTKRTIRKAIEIKKNDPITSTVDMIVTTWKPLFYYIKSTNHSLRKLKPVSIGNTVHKRLFQQALYQQLKLSSKIKLMPMCSGKPYDV